MDLAARKRAWTGSVARPGDVAVLSNCEDDESRRWVVDAALGASAASGVVTRLAYAAAGLALDALPADGAAAPRRPPSPTKKKGAAGGNGAAKARGRDRLLVEREEIASRRRLVMRPQSLTYS